MAERGLSRGNLISLLALIFLVAVVAITPETREILGRLGARFRSSGPAVPVAPTGPREIPAAKPRLQEAKDEAPQVMSPPPHVVRNPDRTFRPEPGYRWTNDDPANLDIVWCPGCVHPEYPNVIAARAEGRWEPAPGYDWGSPGGMNGIRVEWTPGEPHPGLEHVIAAPERDRWTPEPGYEWVDPDDRNDFRVRPVR